MKKYKYSYKNKEWEVKTTDYTASSYDRLIVGTSLTITLPAAPNDLDTISIILNNTSILKITANSSTRTINRFYRDIYFNEPTEIFLIYYSEIGEWILNSNKIKSNILVFSNQICAGYNFTSSINYNEDSIWSWGDNTNGIVGIAVNGTSYSSPVMALVNFNGWEKIAVGRSHALVVNESGYCYSWGINSSGQLGNGNADNNLNYYFPLEIVTTAISFRNISCGDNFSGGIDGSNGTGWTWGINTYGQLGNNTRTSYSSPISIVGGISFKQICCGVYHSAGIRGSDGTAWAWGYNVYGNLGTNNVTSYSSPASVVGGISFTNLYAGSFHNIGIRGSDGTAWAWGYNDYGQLGDNSRTSRSSPVSVVGGISFTQIGAGYKHNIGIRGSDGTAWAWGYNAYGNLGTNNVTSYSSPASVVGGISFAQISCGVYHTIGINGVDNTLWSWGDNTYGQLGTGNRTSYSSPVLVGKLI